MMLRDFVKDLRRMLGITMQEFSEISGLSKSSLSRIETGEMPITEESQAKLFSGFIRYFEPRLEAERNAIKQVMGLWR